jgi:hypothetical protein
LDLWCVGRKHRNKYTLSTGVTLELRDRDTVSLSPLREVGLPGKIDKDAQSIYVARENCPIGDEMRVARISGAVCD